MAGEVDWRRPGEVGSVERLAMIAMVRVPLSPGRRGAARRQEALATTVVRFVDADRKPQAEVAATVHWHEVRWR